MIVIADDITGAAEIAGIAHSHGLHVCLVCGGEAGCDAEGDGADTVTVVATDTRSMTEEEAVAETRRLVGAPHPVIFKKTDSALRGHVVAELTALMEVTGYRRAVYLPANPSKGRIIRDGVYYIREAGGEGLPAREVPIHETAFSYDPEFPARTAVLKERFPDAGAQGIVMPDAVCDEDIARVVAQYNDGQTLFAGAAALFTAFILAPAPTTPPSTLILCGSTQSRTLDLGIPVAPMPRAIYDGADDLSLWDVTAYDDAHSLILSIPHTHRTGREVAVHLRTVMARMARQLVAKHRPEQLIIEGGATAWGALQALGWTDFTIVRQVAPGVVQMRARCGTLVTLKPGSYPWGGLFTM